MRNEWIRALIKQGEHPRLLVLDADCSRSTKTALFKERYPEKFINVGICEQNMVGVAAGLSRLGYIPIIHSFSAMLVSRGAEQIIQTVCMPSLPVKIIGHYAGVSASLEGAPHHALFDLSILRSLPNLEIYTPATEEDIIDIVHLSMLSDKPAYIRLSRNPIIEVDKKQVQATSCLQLYENEQGDILFIAYGPSVQESLKAAHELNNRGVQTGVLSVKQFKPFDTEEQFGSIVQRFRTIITVEEHAIVGGLGSLIAEWLVENKIHKDMYKLGFDRFTETASYDWLLDEYGLSSHSISNFAMSIMIHS